MLAYVLWFEKKLRKETAGRGWVGAFKVPGAGSMNGLTIFNSSPERARVCVRITLKCSWRRSNRGAAGWCWLRAFDTMNVVIVVPCHSRYGYARAQVLWTSIPLFGKSALDNALIVRLDDDYVGFGHCNWTLFDPRFMSQLGLGFCYR